MNSALALPATTMLDLFERGNTLTAIAHEIGMPVGKAHDLLAKEFDAARIELATTRHIDSCIDNTVKLLDECVDKEDVVRVSALKAKLDLLRWRAGLLTSKYRPIKEAAGNGIGGLTINIVGMGGATLRNPSVIDG